MKIKGIERERKLRKRRHGMAVDNYDVRRIQLALIYGRMAPKPEASGAAGGTKKRPKRRKEHGKIAGRS